MKIWILLILVGSACAQIVNGGGGGSGTVSNCTGAGNSYYSGAGTTVNCDTTIVDNGSGTMTFNTSGLQLSGSTLTIAGTNGALNVLPNGTGQLILGAAGGGTAANPAWSLGGQATNTGMYSSNATAFDWTISGTNKLHVIGTGVSVANNGSFCFSQTTSANGTCGPNLAIVGTSTTEYLNSSTPIVDSGKCQANATAITTATTICTFTLPNAATALSLDCFFQWNNTSAATTLALGYNFAQTATNVSMGADIKTSNTNTATEAVATSGSTGATTILTSATPGATGNYQAELHGTFTSSASSGTLLILGTSGSASNVAISGKCWLH